MGLFKSETQSSYVKRELDKIRDVIKPYVKKSSLFSFISFPMIIFSIINLFALVTNFALTGEIILIIGLYALMGALGMAFLKESQHLNRKIQHNSFEYILERIKKSDYLTDFQKETYLENMEKSPHKGIAIFSEFLEQEEQRKKSL
ncbi:YwnF family protein [Evansella cellulosilytica]|uniref:Uncharacterized protein n=1 Tax=Evansella cellulosilytica (strain ATCC 21833 / DSM 2522 / FERM P-1141 / JCM 9156 / N-4) TaxID=649639 RepID=E6TZZ4_EVAC2|nr:YwnF family protein [Evansella cellulosilytica]ADU28998.1 hypothetical protein Bcell_0716 [Evansella cellulosilytica DSM 2522]